MALTDAVQNDVPQSCESVIVAPFTPRRTSLLNLRRRDFSTLLGPETTTGAAGPRSSHCSSVTNQNYLDAHRFGPRSQWILGVAGGDVRTRSERSRLRFEPSRHPWRAVLRRCDR